MDADDQGHRHGNFPNYYSFHPPQNRLQVLEQTNILSYIRNGLLKSIIDGDDDHHGHDGKITNTAVAITAVAADDDTNDESRMKKPRIELEKRQQQPSPQTGSDIYYCDLGCNEGDLTMAMAASLTKVISKDANVCENESTDEASMPNKSIPPMMDGVTVKCLGLDIDPMLIERANTKFSSISPSSESCTNEPSKKLEDDLESSNYCNINAIFKACNLCSSSEHNNAYTSFKNETVNNNDDKTKTITEDAEPHSKELLNNPQKLFHLTSIFSTTMWIHVHAGDEGLRQFLERACSWTERFLLIEPQPSGCYRKANTRLRKMNRPELNDVTSSRLKMRHGIEEEIHKVILKCGFRRVTLEETMEDEEKRDAVTSWNRTLHLYERVVVQ